MLKDKITQDRNDSAKSDSFKKTLLNTILGELTRIPWIKDQKNPTDEEVIKFIKKYIEDNVAYPTPEKLKENTILEVYIPKLMSDEDLKEIVISLIFSENIDTKNKASIGQVMKLLQAKYFGQYDGRKASEIIKNVMNN